MMVLKRLVPFAIVVYASVVCAGQAQAPASDRGAEIEQLRSSLAETRAQLQQCRQEIDDLRAQVRAIRQDLGNAAPAAAPSAAPADASQFPTLADVEKNPAAAEPQVSPDEGLLAEKVAEFEQTKVESASKYKVRLSGMVLMNTYSSSGAVDVTDLPNLAFRRAAGDTSGDFGATLRQTVLGLQVTGPTIAGGQSSADIEMDFYGGIPRTHYGVDMGIARIRTARARLDWAKWSLIAGQDAPFFSPLSPTSYASLAEPALSWSGNLWVWTPQIRVERRWSTSDTSNVAFSFGILDPLTEESPDNGFNRHVDPGESTRFPGLGTHLGWNGTIAGEHATIGLGGYYGKQNWGFDKRVDSWLISTDFDLPLGRYLALSGEVYRGQAIGGLGGGVWTSTLFNGDPDVAGTRFVPLNDVGGWSQLKVKATPKLEFNFAAGTANPLSSDLRVFPNPRNYAFTPFARNQTLIINSIFHPRSNLLVGLEYRRLRTYAISGNKNEADHVNLSIGVSF